MQLCIHLSPIALSIRTHHNPIDRQTSCMDSGLLHFLGIYVMAE